MDIKKVAIGLGSGLVMNTLVEKSLDKFWIEKGKQAAIDNTKLFNDLVSGGMSEEDAALFIEKNDPHFWRKFGARRINGAIALGIGFLAYKYGNPLVKTMGTGIMISGGLKTIYPAKAFDLEYFYK